MSVFQKMADTIKEDPNAIDRALAAVDKARRSARGSAKLIKAISGGGATICVAENLVDISVPSVNKEDPPLGISVVQGAGTVIRGPLGITESPGGIRIAGMWKFNDLLLSAAPSTILTPISVLKFSPPMESLVKMAAQTILLIPLLGVIA